MKQIQTKAFSLIEIIVVTSMITLAFMGVMALVQRSIRLYHTNQQALIAATIAQDGVELARYVRDDNWLKGYPFYQNLAGRALADDKTLLVLDREILETRSAAKFFYSLGDMKQVGVEQIRPCTEPLITQCVKSDYASIYRDTDKHNFFSLAWDNIVNDQLTTDAPSNFQDTTFNRLLEVIYRDNNTSDPEDDYLDIKVTVYWRDHSDDRYYNINTRLYDYTWRY